MYKKYTLLALFVSCFMAFRTTAQSQVTTNMDVGAYTGVYVGNFTGQEDSGGFAMFVVDGKAELVGFNVVQDEGVYARNITVAANGTFAGSTAQGGSLSGTLTANGMSGNFLTSFGGSGTFGGTRKSNDGGLSESAGFYEGTYSGPVVGSAFAVMAADGTIFFYVIDNPSSPAADGDGGGKGTVSLTTLVMDATIVPAGTVINGTLNPANEQITGTYSLSGLTGNFTITLTKSIPVVVPPEVTGLSEAAAAAGLTGDDALPNAIPFGDGVTNLLKFAFNMNLGAPDNTTLQEGGNSGLPATSLEDVDGELVLRLEFLRRNDSDLSYVPQKSATLDEGSFSAMTGLATITAMNAEWERVIVQEPMDKDATPRCFSRVRVAMGNGQDGGGGGPGNGVEGIVISPPVKITSLANPITENLTFSVFSSSTIVSATAQWVSGGKVIKIEDLPTLVNAAGSCGGNVFGPADLCLKTSINEAEAVGPTTLTLTVTNSDGETAIRQAGEFFPNAGPFNGIWAGQVVQQSDCGDDDTDGDTVFIRQGINQQGEMVAAVTLGATTFTGKVKDGVLSGGAYQTTTESGIPVRVTEWEAVMVGPDLLEGSANFRSDPDALNQCSGSFSFSFTRQ